MSIKFSKLDKSNAKIIYDFLENGPSDDTIFSRATLYAWPENHDVCAYIDKDYVLIAYRCEAGRRIFMSPLVKKEENFLKAVEALESHGTRVISQVNSWQAELLKDEGFELRYWPDRSEYLYLPEDLIELKGKKYHAKRNFINGFKYPYTYREYNGSEKDRQGIFDLFKLNMEVRYENEKEIKEEHLPGHHETLDYIRSTSQTEIIAIGRILDDYSFFNVKADVLEIEGKIVGFTAGEVLPNGIGGLYFEKGDINYRGIYPFIDNLYCKTHFQGVRYINKQEDMGIPGLKQSKESYYPIQMAKLYSARRVAEQPKIK